MSGETDVRHEIADERRSRREAAIVELAERQHGVVARAQLRELGLGRGAIAARVDASRLHLVHRGVYALGRRRLSRHGAWMAAVLACGADAVLSHLSAAALWGLRERDRGRVDVISPRGVRPRHGIRASAAAIRADERTVHSGIPVTTVPRTMLDLAATLEAHELRRTLERAEGLKLADPVPLVALLERHRGRRGAACLRAALEEGPLRAAVTRSELERRFLRFLDTAGLPQPQTNVWLQVGGEWIEVDCVWREQRLIAELDGRAFHDSAAAFERDRRRDRRLLAAGWRCVRVTDRALRHDRVALRAELGVLLSRAGAARSA